MKISALSDFFVALKGNLFPFLGPVLACGENPSGDPTTLKTDAAGNLAASTVQVTTPTDRSGTITLGGTAQNVAAANSARKYLLFQNISDTTMWLNFGTVAVADQPSIQIVAGASYENPPHFCPTGSVSVMCATTGKKFVAKEA